MWKPTKATEGIEAPAGLAPWRELDDAEYLVGERAYIESYLGPRADDAAAVRRVRAQFRAHGYYEHDEPAKDAAAPVTGTSETPRPAEEGA